MKTNHGTKIALAALAFLLIAAASPFVSVTVDSITGALRGSSTNLFSANSNRLNSAVNLSSRVAKGGDTMTGTLAVPAITLNGTNLADLIGAGGGGGADKLPLAGGTLTGPLVGTSAAFTNGVNTVTAARTENTFDLPVGLTTQAGPGADNGVGWAYPYGTKFSVFQGTNRAWEMINTLYPEGSMAFRIRGATNGGNWKTLLDSTTGEPLNANKYQGTNSALTVISSSGAVNWTNFTSLAIPSDNNPTTDAAGEIALDRNNDFLEVYVNTAGESRVIPTLQFKTFTIIDPDGLQAVKDAIPLLPVESQWAPFGITIKDIWVKIDAAVSYTVTLEEWTDPATWSSDIETVTISSGTEAKDDGTLADASIAAGSIVFVDLPTTAANFLTVSFTYVINPGN